MFNQCCGVSIGLPLPNETSTAAPIWEFTPNMLRNHSVKAGATPQTRHIQPQRFLYLVLVLQSMLKPAEAVAVDRVLLSILGVGAVKAPWVF